MDTIEKLFEEISDLKAQFAAMRQDVIHSIERVEELARNQNKQSDRIGVLEKTVWRMTGMAMLMAVLLPIVVTVVMRFAGGG